MSGDTAMPKRGRSLHVLRVLRQRIADGTYPLETKLPSERTLAEEFKVSRVTVRKSLEGLKNDGMIMRRPGLGNIISASAPVAPPAPPNIGFVVQHLSNPYYSAFASALEAVLRARELNMILAGTGQNPEEELQCLQRMGERQVRGVLLCVPDHIHRPDAMRAFLKQRLPVVIIGGRQAGVALDSVDSDNRAGMTAAIDYLLDLGHTRIGFLSAIAFGRTDVRMQLTAEILRSKGLEPGHMVSVDTPDLAGGRLALDAMLEREDRPTAVLCTNDITAIGAIQRAFELGVSIPGEFSIVGYDDIPMASMATVPLTTVAVPLAELAELAFERLLARAEGYVGSPIHMTVEPSLVVRGSTAAPELA
ncbi:MAG: GntR family transcriptional regulator [bacterium]|nr:GntR family transcriptional regulator [bacterium]